MKNEGLLVVTDRTNRFDDYLNPMDESVKSFLHANMDRIAVMTAATKNQYQETHTQYPVLLMTTQRYFAMEKKEILQYLTWGENQQRDLIIFDEKPDLYFRFDLSLAAMNQFEAAFILGIEGNEGKKQSFVQKYWNPIKNSFLFHL